MAQFDSLAQMLGKITATYPEARAEYVQIEQEFAAQFRALLVIREMRLRHLAAAHAGNCPDCQQAAINAPLLSPDISSLKEAPPDGPEA